MLETKKSSFLKGIFPIIFCARLLSTIATESLLQRRQSGWLTCFVVVRSFTESKTLKKAMITGIKYSLPALHRKKNVKIIVLIFRGTYNADFWRLRRWNFGWKTFRRCRAIFSNKKKEKAEVILVVIVETINIKNRRSTWNMYDERRRHEEFLCHLTCKFRRWSLFRCVGGSSLAAARTLSGGLWNNLWPILNFKDINLVQRREYRAKLLSTRRLCFSLLWQKVSLPLDVAPIFSTIASHLIHSSIIFRHILLLVIPYIDLWVYFEEGFW